MSSTFTHNIKPFVEAELTAAKRAGDSGNAAAAFRYLENAHVLGQESTFFHVKVHALMLLWAFRHSDWQEFLGQLFRVVGAATKTALGWVPKGNTGGANVSPFKAMPISQQHADAINVAKAAC